MNKILRKTIIPYIGGKHYLKDWIISQFDYAQHDCYIELFGGSGKILFAKPPHRYEIFNDIYSEVVNFFRVLRDPNLSKEFVRIIKMIPYSREEYNHFKYEYDPKTPLDRAIRFFYLSNTSFNGNGGFRTTTIRALAVSYKNKADIIHVFSERLRNVIIENNDFREIIERIKPRFQHRCIIYADPPYMGKENYYKGNFSDKDHEDLARLLNDFRGQVVISYFPDDRLYDLYPKTTWTYLEKMQALHSTPVTKLYDNGKKNYNTELLIVKK